MRAFTSLAEDGSGTLAGNAQMDVWRQIVSRDAAIIGAALDRVPVQPYLRARFPGRLRRRSPWVRTGTSGT